MEAQSVNAIHTHCRHHDLGYFRHLLSVLIPSTPADRYRLLELSHCQNLKLFLALSRMQSNNIDSSQNRYAIQCTSSPVSLSHYPPVHLSLLDRSIGMGSSTALGSADSTAPRASATSVSLLRRSRSLGVVCCNYLGTYLYPASIYPPRT